MNAMSKSKLAASFVLLIALLSLTIGLVARPGRAADHLDSPTTKTDGRVDINDVYIFHPGNPGSQNLNRTVVAMTVNPAAGAISGTEFHPDARYEFLFDLDGDARADGNIRVRFGSPQVNGRQRVVVTGNLEDEEVFKVRGWTEEVIEGEGGVRVFAGLRDDPFFFDLNSFNDGATFCEPGDSDFFLGLNTSAIVVEVPANTMELGISQVGMWGRTVVPGIGQFDRMGRPAILTVFLPPNPFEPSPPDPMLEDAFNFGRPHRDQANFRNEIVDSLTFLFSLNDSTDPNTGDDAAQIQALADILLPDVLTVDLSQETGFLNGRNLADDVIDAELGLITEGAITTDCIDNDSDFLAHFPYLGEPN
jgi:hypothetical protein